MSPVAPDRDVTPAASQPTLNMCLRRDLRLTVYRRSIGTNCLI
jgi:hypothetical protein